MPSRRCICGCGRRGDHQHHAVYVQELRALCRRGAADPRAVYRDGRNLVPIAYGCHAAHHGRSIPLPLRVLPDGVFEFAAEMLEPGPAYEYLRRRYAGGDPRLDALLST